MRCCNPLSRLAGLVVFWGCVLMLAGPTAEAATYTWNSSTGSSPADGSGSWNTASFNWWNGSADVLGNWSGATPDSAIFGAFSGNYGRSVAEGAAMGGALGLAHGAVAAGSPDEVHRRFVETCLGDKGYKPIGWK